MALKKVLTQDGKDVKYFSTPNSTSGRVTTQGYITAGGVVCNGTFAIPNGMGFATEPDGSQNAAQNSVVRTEARYQQDAVGYEVFASEYGIPDANTNTLYTGNPVCSNNYLVQGVDSYWGSGENGLGYETVSGKVGPHKSNNSSPAAYDLAFGWAFNIGGKLIYNGWSSQQSGGSRSIAMSARADIGSQLDNTTIPFSSARNYISANSNNTGLLVVEERL